MNIELMPFDFFNFAEYFIYDGFKEKIVNKETKYVRVLLFNKKIESGRTI